MKTKTSADTSTTTDTTTPATKVKKNLSLKSFVLKDNGLINMATSEAAFHDWLAGQKAKSEGGFERVRGAVDAVFNKLAGTNVNFKYLSSQVAQELTNSGQPIAPEEYTNFDKTLHNYITANKSDSREDGMMFKVGLGRNVGGIRRWSDIPLSAEEAAAESSDSDAPIELEA
jgi:hypothetical protein